MWAYIRLGRLRSTRKSQEVIGLGAGTREVAGANLDACKRSWANAAPHSALVHLPPDLVTAALRPKNGPGPRRGG
jgi:hypothetical protein